MDLERLHAEMNQLKTELDALQLGTPEHEAKLKEAESKRAEIDKLIDVQSRTNALNSSFNMPKPSTVVPGDVRGTVQVNEGFEKDPKMGFTRAGEFMQEVKRCSIPGSVLVGQSPRLNFCASEQAKAFGEVLQTAGTANTTVDGLMIPAELDPRPPQRIGVDASMDWLSMMNVLPTSSNAKEVKIGKEATQGGTGGVQAVWEGEGKQMTSSRNEYKKTMKKVNNLYVFTSATNEDLEDVAFLENDLMVTAPRKMRIKVGEGFLFGSGNGMPLGFTKGGDLASVTRAGSGFAAADSSKMLSRFLGAGNQRGFWMANQGVLADLPQFSVGNQPVWQADFRVGPGGRLHGLPLVITEDCEALGDAGDVLLVNPDGYFAIEKQGGTKFMSSMHFRFDFNEEAFRWIKRITGCPLFENPYTPRDNDSASGNKLTLSNFVRLV